MSRPRPRLFVPFPRVPSRAARSLVTQTFPDAAVAGIFAPMGSPAARSAPDTDSASERDGLLAVAEALGIPWKRILENEVHAERALRRYVGEPGVDAPFWRLVSALPTSLLESWRVRERISGLIWQARLSNPGKASRELQDLVAELSGKGSERGRGESPLARHLGFAYERIRELQAAAGAAEKCHGDAPVRVRETVARTGCPIKDAEWAVSRADSPTRGHRLDDAVRRVREEGFEIPKASSEFRAFVELRRLLSRRQRARSGKKVPGRSAVARPRGRPRKTAAKVIAARQTRLAS